MPDENHNPDWPTIWARKFRRELYRLGKTGRGYTDVIRKFVQANPGNPAGLSLEVVRKFIFSQHPDSQLIAIGALTIFYRDTVHSVEHVRVLSELQESTLPNPSKSQLTQTVTQEKRGAEKKEPDEPNPPAVIFEFEGQKAGKPLSKRTIQKIYENACYKAGLSQIRGIHTLRHCFATHLMEHGVELRYIQELLGHTRSLR